MASVYRVKDRDGKYLPAWRFKIRNERGAWTYGVGWPDKTKTRQHALTLEAECRAVRMGEKDAPPARVQMFRVVIRPR